MDTVNFTDNFLIAMPALEDPYFAHALVYICEHNENGALGIIVNRPIDMDLAGLFDKIDLKLEAENLAKLPVYFGGPVQLDRGFVLHRPVGQWQSTLAVNSEVGLTSSRDVLAAVGSAGLPSEFIVTLGYAGWDAGQLVVGLPTHADGTPHEMTRLATKFAERLKRRFSCLSVSPTSA